MTAAAVAAAAAVCRRAAKWRAEVARVRLDKTQRARERVKGHRRFYALVHTQTRV